MTKRIAVLLFGVIIFIHTINNRNFMQKKLYALALYIACTHNVVFTMEENHTLAKLKNIYKTDDVGSAELYMTEDTTGNPVYNADGGNPVYNADGGNPVYSFNENQYTFISINNFSYYQSVIQLVPRYVLGTIKYRF